MLRATQLVRQQFALLLGAGKLRLRTHDLRLELPDLAAQHRRLGVELVFSRGHHRGLVGHRLARGGLFAMRPQIAKIRRVAAVALGDQPRFGGERGIAVAMRTSSLARGSLSSSAISSCPFSTWAPSRTGSWRTTPP